MNENAYSLNCQLLYTTHTYIMYVVSTRNLYYLSKEIKDHKFLGDLKPIYMTTTLHNLGTSR